jgi:endonuclease G
MYAKNDVLLASSRRIKNVDMLIKNAKSGPPSKVESRESYARRLDIIKAEGSEPLAFAEERLMGKNDLMPLAYLQKGLDAARSVGKVNVIDQTFHLQGNGTGFLIAPGLLITNHHVLESANWAVNSTLEMNFERDVQGRLLKSSIFSFRPDIFFYTNDDLDLTVVVVNNLDLEQTINISSYAYLPLISQLGKIATGEALSIIQHPGGQEKRIAIRENLLIEHDSPNFIWYQTDTTPGSSGAPVFNDEWQVVALHHMGVPRDGGHGMYLRRDGTPVKPDKDGNIDVDDLQWIANEGVRVSAICEALLKDCPPELLSDRIKNLPPPEPVHVEHPATVGPAAEQLAGKGPTNTSELVVPLYISARLGDAKEGIWKVSAKASADALSEKNIVVDQHYGNRKGYDEEFLGVKIPLPRIPSEMKGSLAGLISDPTKFELKYYHFSTVVNKERRMPVFGAVNFDGESYGAIADDIPPRKEIGSDKWYADTRIDESSQLPKKFYDNNDWDLGHMVRREEPVWGSTVELAIKANNDTFHLTNACPQHKTFNQGKGLWQGIENYILDNARAHNLRITIFTGPMLRANDKEDERNGIKAKIPAAFWKVVVMPKVDGQLSATGYLASQEEFVHKMEEFVFGQYQTYQVPISEIEKLTGLKFDLSQYDPKEKADDGLHEMMERKRRLQPIQSIGDLEF